MICRKGELMKALTRYSILLSLLCAFSGAISAQDAPRKFATTYEITMYKDASFRSGDAGKIPSNVVLEALQETEHYGGYIKVIYKKKQGWILKAEVKRHMDVPAAEMICFSNGYQIIRDVYRYFLACRNDGVLPYNGTLTIRLYNNQDKVSFEKIANFSSDPIPSGGGPFYLDSATEAPRFEIAHQGGTIKGGTGKLIERIP